MVWKNMSMYGNICKQALFMQTLKSGREWTRNQKCHEHDIHKPLFTLD